MSNAEVATEKRLIQIKADYLTKLNDPQLSLARLSESQIRKWKSSDKEGEQTINSFKLALDSVSKNLTVTVHKLPPSQIGYHSDRLMREEEKQNMNHDSDNEVIFTKKRSRSASPVSSESSKLENDSQHDQLNDLPSSEKMAKRQALSTKLDENKKAHKRTSLEKELKRLSNGGPLPKISDGNKRPRRLAGPASIMKSRELKLLMK